MTERSDPRKLEFSPSSMTDMSCWRKWYLRKVLRLVPVGRKKNSAVFGQAVHAGIACMKRAQNQDRTDHEQVVLEMCQAAVAEFQQGKGIEDARGRNIDNLLVTMQKYAENYYQDGNKWETIEEAARVEMPDGSVLMGIIDGLVAIQEGFPVVVHDSKTSSYPATDFYWRQWENHPQLTAYLYMVRELVGRCDNVVIDYVGVPFKDMEHSFCRRSFFRTDLQIQEWLNTYQYDVAHVKQWVDCPDLGARHFPQRQDQCDRYGGCPYLEVCIHGLDNPSIAIDFEKETQGCME